MLQGRTNLGHTGGLEKAEAFARFFRGFGEGSGPLGGLQEAGGVQGPPVHLQGASRTSCNALLGKEMTRPPHAWVGGYTHDMVM